MDAWYFNVIPVSKLYKLGFKLLESHNWKTIQFSAAVTTLQSVKAALTRKIAFS